MKRHIALSIVMIFFLSHGFSARAMAQSQAAQRDSSRADQERSDAQKEIVFQLMMRDLWQDYITWTRLFAVSSVAMLPDKTEQAARLLQTQIAIGRAFKPFYGGEAGDKLTSLLKEHSQIAAEYIAAAIEAETSTMDFARARWEANADEIASFLSGANPKNWPLEQVRAAMRAFVHQTTQQVEFRLRGNWKADVKAFEKAQEQILRLEKMLSSGIIKQFQKKLE